MTSTLSNHFQPTRRPSMMTSCSPPPTLAFSSVLYSPNMNEDPSDEILNGDKRSAHNALERQRREGLNNKFQQLAHVLPGLQNVRRPSKSMIVTKSLEFVSKAVQRDSSYQNKIKQLRKEYQTLRKHTTQLCPTTTTKLPVTKKRTHQQMPASPSKRRQQMTLPVTNKKSPSPIRHKFVHHHASASSPEKKAVSPPSCTTTTTSPPPPPPAPVTTMPIDMQPSWPLLDLSGISFMDHHPQQQPTTTSFYSTVPTIPFFTNDTTTTTTTPLPFYPTDPSYAYFWK